MGWFSDIAGPLVGGVLGLGGSLWASENSAESAAASIAFQREALQNKYQWSVADMKKAGLNPALAYGGISSGVPSGAVAKFENPGAAAVQSAAAAKQIQIAERQQSNLDMVAKAQADNFSAQSVKAAAETANINAQTESGLYVNQSEMYGASADEMRQKKDLLITQQKQIEQDIIESAQRVEKLGQEVENLRKERERINESISNIRMERDEISSRTKLNQVNAALGAAEKDYAAARTKTQNALTVYQNVLTSQEELKMPKLVNEAFYHNSAVGKFIDRYAPRLGTIFLPYKK